MARAAVIAIALAMVMHLVGNDSDIAGTTFRKVMILIVCAPIGVFEVIIG